MGATPVRTQSGPDITREHASSNIVRRFSRDVLRTNTHSCKCTMRQATRNEVDHAQNKRANSPPPAAAAATSAQRPGPPLHGIPHPRKQCTHCNAHTMFCCSSHLKQRRNGVFSKSLACTCANSPSRPTRLNNQAYLVRCGMNLCGTNTSNCNHPDHPIVPRTDCTMVLVCSTSVSCLLGQPAQSCCNEYASQNRDSPDAASEHPGYPRLLERGHPQQAHRRHSYEDRNRPPSSAHGRPELARGICRTLSKPLCQLAQVPLLGLVHT